MFISDFLWVMLIYDAALYLLSVYVDALLNKCSYVKPTCLFSALSCNLMNPLTTAS